MSLGTLFNSALRQSNAIKKDLATFTDAPASGNAALQGQINASLTSFSRTVDDYARLAKQEIIEEKKEKAANRVKNFRAKITDFREQYEKLKKEREDTQATQSRADLFARRPHHTATPENPYANESYSSQASAFKPAHPSVLGASPQDYGREQHAFREQSFMASTNAQLDDFLDRGRAVLGDLGQQREMLKGTQKRLYSVATTLGISGDTIRMVERRAKQDKWIFWGGVIVFFVFCYLVLRYLR